MHKDTHEYESRISLDHSIIIVGWLYGLMCDNCKFD